MKKLLLIGILVLCGLVLNVSCNLEGDSIRFVDPECFWQIANKTDGILKFKYPKLSTHYAEDGTSQIMISYHAIEILPNGVALIFATGSSRKPFNYVFESISKYEEHPSWQILSEDDVVLKYWNYDDEELLDQRFFEESSWISSYDEGHSVVTIPTYIWTFKIVSEDIVSE
jgi:hypothetical protein